MQYQFDHVKKEAEDKIAQILLIDEKERTFENTALSLDKARADFHFFRNAISLMRSIHPDPKIQLVAEELLKDLTILNLDLFRSPSIYKAINSLPREDLNNEREYFLNNFVDSFKYSGFLLNKDDLEKMKSLENQISSLCLQFTKNIDQDESILYLKEDEIAIFTPETFPKEGNDYLVPCNRINSAKILNLSPYEAVRENCYEVYYSRAFPQNLGVLKELIETRHKLALLLGFNNYAEMDLSDQMAKTPEQVHSFIQTLADSEKEKIQAKWKLMV